MRFLPLFLVICSSLASASPQPYARTTLKVQPLMKLVQEKMENTSSPQTLLVLGTLHGLGDAKITLDLFGSPEQPVQPRLVIDGDLKPLHSLFAKGGMLSGFVETTGTNTYKISSSSLDSMGKGRGQPDPKDIGLGDWTLSFTNEQATLLASSNLESLIKNENQSPLFSTHSKKLEGDKIWFKTTILLPEEISEKAPQIGESSALKGMGPMSHMVQKQFESMWKLAQPFKGIQSISLAASSPKEDIRALELTLSADEPAPFRKKLQRWVESNNIILKEQGGAPFEIQILKEPALGLKLDWSKSQDSKVGKGIQGILSREMMSMMMSTSMVPTEGPIQERTQPLMSSGSLEEIPKTDEELERLVKEFTYPGHSWTQNDHLAPSCVLGPMVFPGSHLTKVKGRITNIYLDDGTVIPANEDSRWNRGLASALQGTHLRGLIPKTTKKESITEMEVEVELELPKEVHSVSFNQQDPSGTKKTSGPITFTLEQMEKDLVMLRCHPPRSIELLGRNAKGEALYHSMSTGGAGEKRQKFAGIPEKVEAMVVNSGNRMFKFRIPYPEGRAPRVSTEPSDSIGRKYAQHVQPQYASIITENLDPKNIQTHEEHGRSGLSWKLADGFPHGHANWVVNAFGKNGPISLMGYSGTNQDGEITFLNQVPSEEVLLWWGEVQLSFSANIQGGEIHKKKPSTFKLPKGEVKASIDRNALILTSPYKARFRALNIQAYDAEGLPLERATSSSRTDNDVRTEKILFWGQVEKVRLQFQDGEIKKTIPFELAIGEVDSSLRESYEKKLKEEGEILKSLFKANRGLRYSGGANLCAADLRYALNHNGNPMNLITEAMAESDPKGAEIYGYEVKPWKGYYITTSDGTLVNDKKQPHKLREESSLIITTQGPRKVDILNEQSFLIAIPVDKTKPILSFRYEEPIRIKKYEEGFLTPIFHSSDGSQWEKVTVQMDHSGSVENLFKYSPRLKVENYKDRKPQHYPPLLIDPKSRPVEEHLSTSIFPYRLYAKRDYLTVDFDAGPFPIPSIARGQLTLKELIYKDGSKVEVVSEKATMPKRPSNLDRAYFRFGVQPQEKPDQLQALVISANVHVPEGHQKIIWTQETPIGKIEGGEDGVGLNLLRFEGQVLETVVFPAMELRYQGYDQDGKIIPILYKSNTSLQHGVVFEKAPHRVEVLLPKAWRHHLVDLTIPFEGGQERKLPNEPSDSVPFRYQSDTLSTYSPVDKDLVDQAKPAWNAKRNTIDLPVGKTRVSINTNWKLRGFGESEPLKVEGYSSTYSGTPVFRMNRPNPSLRFIEGEVSISSYGNIHKLNSLDKATELGNAPLTIDRNQASITLARSVQILDSLVLDEHGFPLKHFTRSSYSGSEKTTTWVAWGQIGSIQALIAKDPWTLKKKVELKLGHYDREAYERHKKIETLKDDLFNALYFPDRMNYPVDDCPSAVWLLKHGISMEGEPLNLLDNELTVIKDDSLDEPTSKVKLGSYTISNLKGRIYRGEQKDYEVREYLNILTTQGRMRFKKYSEEPARVAIPDDPKLPTYIYYNGLYSTDRLDSEYVPENYSQVWKRVSWNYPSVRIPKIFISYLKKKPSVDISTTFTPPPFEPLDEKEILSKIEKGFSVQSPYKSASYLRGYFHTPMSIHTALSKNISITLASLLDQEGNNVLKRNQKYSVSQTSSSLYLYFYGKEKMRGTAIKSASVDFQVTYPSAAIDKTFTLDELNKNIPELKIIHQDDDSLEVTHRFGSPPLVIAYHSSGNQLLPLSMTHKSGYFSAQFSGKIHRLRLIRPTAWKTAQGEKELLVHDKNGKFIGNTTRHAYLKTVKFESEVPEEQIFREKVKWVSKNSSRSAYAFFPYSGTAHPHYGWNTTTVYDNGKILNNSYTSHQYDGKGLYFYPRQRRGASPIYLEGELMVGASTNIKWVRLTPTLAPQKLDVGHPRPLGLEKEDDKLLLKVPKVGHLCTSYYIDQHGFIMQDPPKKSVSNKNNDPEIDYGYMYTVSPPVMPGEILIQYSDLPLKKPVPFVFNIGKLSDEEMEALKQKSQTSQDITPLLKQIIKAYAPYHPYYEVGLAERFYVLNKDKKASALIPVEVAHSDPLGAKAFGYQAKPYLGYTFTIAKGWSKKGMPQPYKTTKAGSVKLKWEKGEVPTSRHKVDPVVIAIPKDKKLPVFYLEKGSIYHKIGGPTDFIPVKEERKGWKKL